MKTINVKLLAFLLVAAGLFTVGVHLLHGFQERRNAGVLLRQAEHAEAEGEIEQSLKYLKNYLGLAPNDTDALARYGQLLNRQAVNPNGRIQALLVLEQVLRREPGRYDVRRELVRIAMHPQVGRFSDAREHLAILLAGPAVNDPELEQQLAQCHEANGDYPQAAGWYEKATGHAPDQITNYAALAELFRRRLDKPKRADEVMDRLVKANPESFAAYLARAQYRQDQGRDALAAEDVDRAAKLAPDEASVILALASRAVEQGKFDEARPRLQRGLELYPRNASLYLLLADLEGRSKRSAEATACLRRGVAAIPDSRLLLWALANGLIEQGHEPAEEMTRLAQQGLGLPQREFLRARVLMNQSQWLQASRVLARVQSELQRWPDLVKQANLLLGQCYGHLGNIDLQYTAYRRAVSVDPLWEPGCLGLAAAQTALGQIDDALDTYRRMMLRTPAVRLPMARLLVAKNLRLPAGRRNWQEVSQLLDEAVPSDGERNEITILRAEVLTAQGTGDQALALLQKARDEKPEDVDRWLALATLTERQGQPEAALVLIADAERRLGDRVELRVARAWYWGKHGGAEAKTALSSLSKDLEKFSAEEQRRILQALARSYVRLGERVEAGRLWTRLAQQAPTDLGLKLVLFDLAMQAGDEPALKRLLQEMEAIEGSDGALWRYGKACCLIRQAKQGQPEAVAQAQTLLDDLAAARPTWARVPLSQAVIDELRKDLPAAIKNLQRAVALGERDPLPLRRLVELLYQQRRYVEADEVVQKLSEQDAGIEGLQRLAAEISLQRNDPDRALQLARQAVSSQSKDYRDFLWLGQFIGATAQHEQAEPLLRRAVELADTVPDTWVALILYLARLEKKDKAEAALRQAQNKLGQEQASAALAPCHEALGHLDEARKLWTAALAAGPKDAGLLRNVAGFYLRQGLAADAEKTLRQMAALEAPAPEDAAWARRTLAVMLASGGDYQRWCEAVTLMGLTEDGTAPQTTGANIEDQRVRAVVLAAHKNRRQRTKAIGLLEEVSTKQALSAEEQFLLSQLYESIGDWSRARQQMIQLLAVYGNQGRYLTHYARSLVRRGEVSEAELWVDKLQKLPEAAGTYTLIELTVRLLAGQHKTSEVVRRLQEYRNDNQARPADAVVRLSLTAGLLDEMCQAYPADKEYLTAAEKAYRELVTLQPERILVLVSFLTRRGQPAEALQLCEQAWSKCPAAAVGAASVIALRAARAGDDQQLRVERRLTEAIKQDAQAAPQLLVCLADLREWQGKFADAERFYRQALDRDRRNVVALNNLAYLLAFQKNKGAEALQLQNQAIVLAGPRPELVDTRAVIRLQMGQAPQAVKDLEEAVANAPQAALCYHLARAHQLANNRPAAVDALRRAKTLGLQADQLHALERGTFQQLHADLEVEVISALQWGEAFAFLHILMAKPFPFDDMDDPSEANRKPRTQVCAEPGRPAEPAMAGEARSVRFLTLGKWRTLK